ncbi:hypothetical protein FGADI_12326 [Fusarium gaditjirri]|uniref:Uncharacterized protein n=1 Tax=Fusarium gaditjirri TaxID=282569 RepID=A0A8H4WPC8_9HYPO|nr:hypothetical protein FGADI_12326 [Fusarium gaditjirri]
MAGAPSLVRGRLLQAKRTRRYRKRRKARKDNITANHQGEPLSHDVGSVAENELLEPEIDSFPDAEEIEDNGIFACDNFSISIQEVDDSTIGTIEPDPYYEEEILDIDSAKEGEDQRQPQSPQIYAEGSANLDNDDTNTDVEYTVQKLIQQFLAGIHGCSIRSHRESLTAHIEVEGPDNHHGLDRLVPNDVPHTLDKEYILAPETDDDTTELTTDQWQAIFTGSTTQDSDGKPKQACLHVEQPPRTPPGVSSSTHGAASDRAAKASDNAIESLVLEEMEIGV